MRGIQNYLNVSKNITMRLLIATPLYPPDIGGPATFAKMVADEFPKRGITVSLALFGAVVRWPSGIRHVLFFFTVLRKGRNAEVILALDPLGVGLPAAIAAKLLRKPFVLRVAGDRAWETGVQRHGILEPLDIFSAKRSGVFSLRVIQTLQRFVCSLAGVVIVPSEYFKTVLLNWGVPEQKIRVVYSAFEEPQRAPDKAAARKELNLSGTILLSAGRLVPWKGFAMLIDLMPELKQEFSDLMLIIAGEGPERDALTRKINECGLRERVILVGKIEQKKLFSYIAASDVFVLNTGYEGFSHQLLEVMALGIPIITTAIGGNVEIIRDGEEGLLVGYNEREALKKALVHLLADRHLQETLAAKARQRLEEFGKEKALNRLIFLVNEACASS